MQNLLKPASGIVSYSRAAKENQFPADGQGQTDFLNGHR